MLAAKKDVNEVHTITCDYPVYGQPTVCYWLQYLSVYPLEYYIECYHF